MDENDIIRKGDREKGGQPHSLSVEEGFPGDCAGLASTSAEFAGGLFLRFWGLSGGGTCGGLIVKTVCQP